MGLFAQKPLDSLILYGASSLMKPCPSTAHYGLLSVTTSHGRTYSFDGLKISWTSMVAILYSLQDKIQTSFLKFLFIFREKGRERERERNIDAWEKHRLTASCTPPTRATRDQPATHTCALTWNGIGDLAICRMMPKPLSYISQGKNPNFLSEHIKDFIVWSLSVPPASFLKNIFLFTCYISTVTY